MPSLLGRRRAGSNASRSSSLASTTRTPLEYSTQSNAATAASAAFLSSAAAAAALRSHTTTPDPVGNIQTRRMVRRGSNSSNASTNVAAGGRPDLQRRGSSSSMTERTFRSPSPGGRSNSISNGAKSPAYDAPPVPAIPKRVPSGHQRSASLEPQPRVLSPTGSRSGGRAMSMDRRTLPPPASGRPGKRLSDVNEELERIDTNNNINFSRPRSSQPSSPTSPTSAADKQYTHGTGAWFSEPVSNTNAPRKTAREVELENKIARIQAAAGKPVRKTHEDTSAQGNHLSKANHEAISGEAPATYETDDTIMVFDPASRTFISKPNPKAKAPAQPQSPFAQQKGPAPGTYDPNTRTIVPMPASKIVSRPSSIEQKPQRLAVDPVLEPPPRNPARISPTGSPVSSRLHKQPSVVREEPEAEEVGSQAGSDYTDTGRVFTGPAGPAKSYTPANAQKERSSSLDIPHGSLDSALRDRGNSTSPSPNRSARFSASPIIQAKRHDPPNRDISPAKSALKHSPASSLRTTSPLANYVGIKSPGSEMSDTASQASQDAFPVKRKKSVRVSFDEQPQEIEVSTAVATPTAIHRSRSPALDDVDDEELMRPRPALPTFGSVRNQRVTPDVAEKVTEMAPERHDASNDHAIGGILRSAHEEKSSQPPVPLSVATTEDVDDLTDDGEEMNQPATSATFTNPAEATEVEAESAQPVESVVKDLAAAGPALAATSSTEDVDVPAINLLPPTPGLDEEQRTLTPDKDRKPKQRASAEIKVPGSFAKSDETDAEVTSAAAANATAAAILADHDSADLADEPAVLFNNEERSPMLTPIDEDTDDEFSDAAEDLSELDNGGFASLDAIAVSPVAKPSPPPSGQATTVIPEPPDSPSVHQASKKMEDTQSHEAKTSGDWGEATAYWSRLSRQQREQIERDHLSSDDEARPTPTSRKTKKKATTSPVETAARAVAAPVQEQPAVKPAMRKSMRAQPQAEPAAASEPGEVHLRKSMRSGSAGGMATTMRSGSNSRPQSVQASSALQNKSMRPVSASALPASAASAASHRRQDGEDVTVPQDSSYPKMQSKSSAQPKPQPKPQPAPVMTAKLQKELTNDSDSESSFRKKKRASAGMGMKRSMRGGPAEPVRERRPTSPEPGRRKGADSFSIRSLSPTGSFFGRKKRVEEVRQSIRGSADGGYRTTLRNGPPAKARSSKPAPASGSKFKSRFADSDDEDEDERPRRGGFRSRFADSDDEDDDVFIPADLTPVRGIPRRKGQTDGDSTDLEDEDEDETDRRRTTRSREKQPKPMVPNSADIDAAMEIARQRLGMTNGATTTGHDTNEGGTLQKGSLRNSQAADVKVEPKSRTDDVDLVPEKKKRGLMGSILRRNRASTVSIPSVRSPTATTDAPALPSTPVTNPPSALNFSPQSPVSPHGKLIRRSSQQPRLKRGDSNYSNATAPPAMGESNVNREWPLAPPVPQIPSEYGRPVTSDGAGGKVHFDEESVAGGNGVYSARTGKKKKFGLLRKAFGLDD